MHDSARPVWIAKNSSMINNAPLPGGCQTMEVDVVADPCRLSCLQCHRQLLGNHGIAALCDCP